MKNEVVNFADDMKLFKLGKTKNRLKTFQWGKVNEKYNE